MGFIYYVSLNFQDFRKLCQLLGEELQKRQIFILREHQLHNPVVSPCYNGDGDDPSEVHKLLRLFLQLHSRELDTHIYHLKTRDFFRINHACNSQDTIFQKLVGSTSNSVLRYTKLFCNDGIWFSSISKKPDYSFVGVIDSLCHDSPLFLSNQAFTVIFCNCVDNLISDSKNVFFTICSYMRSKCNVRASKERILFSYRRLCGVHICTEP